MSVQSKLTAIADKLRQFYGTVEKFSLDGMAERLGYEIADLESANEWMAAEFERLKAEYGEDATEFHPFKYVAQLIDNAPEYIVAGEENYLEYYAMFQLIAAKITALNGNITPGSDSDREIVAQEMDKAIAGMRNAYAAIAEKGGTVPTEQVMSGLGDAVRTIKAGIDVKTKSGTATTDGQGYAQVDCGFKPDLVVLTGYKYSPGTNYNVEGQLSFCFDAALHEGEDGYDQIAVAYADTYPESNQMNANFRRNDTGFEVGMFILGSNGQVGAFYHQFNYKAVKYTP